MDVFRDVLGIGLESKDLTVLNVSLRGIIVFFYCIFLVRVADKRFLSRKSALDAVLGFIFASMMARAINGSASFAPTLVGGLVVVLLHRLLAHLAVHWHPLGELVKGAAELAIQDGKPIQDTLRKNSFSERDMLEDLRLSGVSSPGEVEIAFIERNGKMSVIKRAKG